LEERSLVTTGSRIDVYVTCPLAGGSQLGVKVRLADKEDLYLLFDKPEITTSASLKDVQSLQREGNIHVQVFGVPLTGASDHLASLKEAIDSAIATKSAQVENFLIWVRGEGSLGPEVR
jgi:hypothetical protein